MIENERHLGIPRVERYCVHCKNCVENEYNFVVTCPLYIELRNTYIPTNIMPHLH